MSCRPDLLFPECARAVWSLRVKHLEELASLVDHDPRLLLLARNRLIEFRLVIRVDAARLRWFLRGASRAHGVDLTLGRKQQLFVIVQLARDQLLAGHQLFGHPLLLASLPLHHQAFLDLATLVLIQELLAKLRLA